MPVRLELTHPIVPRSPGLAGGTCSEQLHDIAGRAGAGVFDRDEDLPIQGCVQTFESLSDLVVCGGVLVDEREAKRELIAVVQRPCEVGFDGKVLDSCGRRLCW
jgi:hypothetical protein